MPRQNGLRQSLGSPLIKNVLMSRVLLVGAGGIGCELLKNLVCSGFGSYTPTQTDAQEAKGSAPRKAEIVVIDLDTIDLSNLNRQFLFRKHHIKKPKAFVAKETASQFNPDVNIDAHHANIFDAQYSVEFFEGFDVVFNALDNLAARRHVNKMCLAANVPLIESGTTGFKGQVQPIRKGVTECYDCNPKPVQKTFAICTIRSTPSQPIHCIVWAKSYLFPELFGTSETEGAGTAEMAVTSEDNAKEVAKLQEEAKALKAIRDKMGTSDFARDVFNKVFRDDIERLRSMTEMWQSRKAPEPLKLEASSEDWVKQGQRASKQDQKVWTLLENISVFCCSIEALSSRVQAGEKVIDFDKDDKDTLDFVAAAANLRSHIFSIPLHSEWEIKQMAGNIIPAIATSNALTAGLCVLEAFKILRAQLPAADTATKSAANHSKSSDSKEELPLGGAKTVFLVSSSTERLIMPQGLAPPNPDCAVCSPVYAKLALPSSGQPKLRDLVELLKQRVGYEDFSITINEVIKYDPELHDNLEKSLADVGIDGQSNHFITVMDDDDEPRVDLLLSTTLQPVTSEDSGVAALHLIPDMIELPLKPKKEASEEAVNGVEDEPEPVLMPSNGAKRKRAAEDEAEAETANKRSKGNEGEPVVVEEDDGVILLD